MLNVEELVGQTCGPYQIEQLLGHGKVNAVFIARHRDQNQPVMLTVFLIPTTLSPQAKEQFVLRFTLQMPKLIQLHHPHILPINDFGVQPDYPYMVTPLMIGGSLAKLLKQETRLTPLQTLPIAKQIAAALDYAHSNNIIHGTLKPANILLDDEQQVQVSGFGFLEMLALRGVEQSGDPYAHLYSIAHTFLGTPEYIAPEVVQGAPADARSDVYSLGIMVFELLTGQLPFTGPDPFTTAMMHVQRPVPSLKTTRHDLPAALDLVVQRALERNPMARYQSAGQFITAFERVLKVLEKAERSFSGQDRLSDDGEATLPPTLDLFEETSHGTGLRGGTHIPQKHTSPALEGLSTSAAVPTMRTTGNWQIVPPVVSSKLPAITPQHLPMAAAPLPAPAPIDTLTGTAIDPFTWASSAAMETANTQQQAGEAEPGTFNPLPPQRFVPTRPLRSRRTANKGRRRTIALLATGGVVAAGILGIGGISLAHMLPLTKQPQTTARQSAASASQAPMHTPAPAATRPPTATQNQKGMKPQPTPTKKPTPAGQQMAQPTPAPTQAPTPPPTHTGTVIGSTNQAVNSAKAFTNPADGNGSLLVHLSAGTFVAYESACTHEGVTVYYDPASGHFICPRHGAIFDPAKNGNVLRGPASRPLPAVQVRVNPDGTVTTG